MSAADEINIATEKNLDSFKNKFSDKFEEINKDEVFKPQKVIRELKDQLKDARVLLQAFHFDSSTAREDYTKFLNKYPR